MKELNFNDYNYFEDTVFAIDDLTYNSICYNVEESGMQWEDLITLFGEDTIQAAQMRYERQREMDNE